MKKKYMAVMLAICAVIFMSLWSSPALAEAAPKTVDVMFTHDTHSHLNQFETVDGGEAKLLGGFSRIMTLIQQKRSENPDMLLLDAGDFSMGTLVQTVFEDTAAEIRLLGALGYDATTFGNHEFDYRAKGLANMMTNAVASGDRLPELIVSNVDWERMLAEGLTEEQQLLWDAFETYSLKEYTVFEKNGVRIAVLGLFGEDCLDCAPSCPLVFKNPTEAAKETVAKIQAEEDVDMIVCISHCGTWKDAKKSEDEILAKSVPEIDLIISGHTHSKIEEPIVHGDTYIVSCGEYGKYVGSLSMVQKENGRWGMDSYELITVSDEITPDAEIQEKVDEMIAQVDTVYLKQFGFTKDQVLAYNDIEFATSKDTGALHTELNLGSFMADAYAYAVEQLTDADTHPVDVAVAPAGTIRDTYAKGNITTEHVFNSFSLGIGADGIPGYPLISVYLTGAELKTVAEIDASISDLMTYARLYTDGLYWHYNPNRMILNKVTDVFLVNAAEERVELEDDKLYRVVTDFYTSQMLGSVTDLSYGLLSIVPKFADGTPVENYEDAIVLTTDGRELKAWAAIAEYMVSFEDTDGDGIGEVPDKYAAAEGRKVVEDSKSLTDILKNPNRFFFMIIAAVLILIALLVAIIAGIVCVVRKIRRKRL